ncbi:hypothetical protein M8C21_020621 [Ambrosia artemisiifolia]|uniref:Uncharacterized protein n=1 Tax=Ambrosia artemisiifolia TaxID=4212 RepID=A0AAD5C7C3_AMBAR|nr:hypothetical protein M8C21_020621 [Ambrosia artemisiifolia]
MKNGGRIGREVTYLCPQMNRGKLVLKFLVAGRWEHGRVEQFQLGKHIKMGLAEHVIIFRITKARSCLDYEILSNTWKAGKYASSIRLSLKVVKNLRQQALRSKNFEVDRQKLRDDSCKIDAKGMFLCTRNRKSMLEAFHEVAIYIQRFHHLDLSQQRVGCSTQNHHTGNRHK